MLTNTVFFDLDGTLLDPKVGITTSIQYALGKLGADVPTKDELTWCIGPPLMDSFCSLVGEEKAQQSISFYRERYGDVGWMENTPYVGIAETLARLVENGFTLYVATSKPQVYAAKIVEHFELGQYFSGVFGSELDGTRADKADLLSFALSATQPTAVATMVGDRKHDVLGARANGMNIIGVTYGYGSPQELEQAGAKVLVNRPKDLLPALLTGVPREINSETLAP
ncbi:HAD family hydrolase [Leptothoe sp. PORK10 BA2]|nr:HAD family hydrolase [Leptothoe sp. PORK10 BA2]MEA5462579.1 HAD family hydrolase [Leptothoe sp. PORK10 BA2]